MAVKIKTKYGVIDIDNAVIATVVGGAATEILGWWAWPARTKFGTTSTRFSTGRTFLAVWSFARKTMG